MEKGGKNGEGRGKGEVGGIAPWFFLLIQTNNVSDQARLAERSEGPWGDDIECR